MCGRFARSVSTVGPAWILASLAAAALAHALIASAGPWLAADADAYGEHAHPSVAPVVLVALALVAAGLLRIGAGVAARRRGTDPVALFAGDVAALPAIVPLVAICAGAFATLIAMEFSEQFASFGHVHGVTEALGGSPAVGCALVLAVAATIALAGRRCAAGFLAVATAAAEAMLGVLRPRGALERSGLPATRGRDRRPAGRFAALLARSRGMRAPPAAA